MHGMIRDADNSGSDTGDYRAHYRQVVESAVSLVKEYIDPFHPLGAGIKLSHHGSVLVEHLACWWASIVGDKRPTVE